MRFHEYKKFCRLNGVPARKFNLDMDVKWNSTYLMLQKIISYREVFTNWITKQLGDDVLGDDDWTVANVFYNFLDTFYSNTCNLSAIYTPTSHIIMHCLCEMSVVLKENRNKQLLGPIVRKMEAKFKKY